MALSPTASEKKNQGTKCSCCHRDHVLNIYSICWLYAGLRWQSSAFRLENSHYLDNHKGQDARKYNHSSLWLNRISSCSHWGVLIKTHYKSHDEVIKASEPHTGNLWFTCSRQQAPTEGCRNRQSVTVFLLFDLLHYLHQSELHYQLGWLLLRQSQVFSSSYCLYMERIFLNKNCVKLS